MLRTIINTNTSPDYFNKANNTAAIVENIFISFSQIFTLEYTIAEMQLTHLSTKHKSCHTARSTIKMELLQE